MSYEFSACLLPGICGGWNPSLRGTPVYVTSQHGGSRVTGFLPNKPLTHRQARHPNVTKTGMKERAKLAALDAVQTRFAFSVLVDLPTQL